MAVNSDTIINIKIPIPSLNKQKKIVSYCDEIDTTIKSELTITSNEILMKNIMETYLKTNNEISNDENKSDTKLSDLSESYDNKNIETKPV